ncbi:hypothetical protein AAVH_43160, partial [Aphelenchoides avenae]
MKKVHEYLEQTFPGIYRILIFSDRSETETVYNSGNNAKYNICLYHHNGHYDVIKTPQKFFGAKHYCVDCEKTFQNTSFHRDCKLRCAQCFRSGQGFPCNGDWPIELECPDCRKFFANQECMDNAQALLMQHLSPMSLLRSALHHRSNASCYIRPRGAKKSTPHRIVAYDVETIIQKSRRPLPSTDEEETGSEASAENRVHAAEPFLVDDDGNDIAMEEDDEEEELPRRRDEDEDEDTQSQGSTEAVSEADFGVCDDPNRTDHEVNYIAAIVMCTECIGDWTWADYENQNCEICGPRKVFKCGEWEVEGEGRDVVDEFLDFLLHELPAGYPTYAYAHNGGRYDGAFMLQKLQARPKLRPTISVKRSKHNNAVHLHDSCLLFPMRLEEAPDAFNLPVKPKGDFPYLYNMRENYGKPIDGLPPAEDYILSRSKNTDELNAFLKRHEEEDKKRREEGTPFVLEEVLEEYSFNDVEILAHAVLQFREIFNDQAGCDLFVECTTISCGCMRLWRKKYLKFNTVAIVPNNGYGRHDRQSAVALKYLKWFEWAHGVNMRYSNSDNGEKGRCNVAACPYCELLPEQEVAIEFNGCAYHGCPFKCFPNDTKLPTGK